MREGAEGWTASLQEKARGKVRKVGTCSIHDVIRRILFLALSDAESGKSGYSEREDDDCWDGGEHEFGS